MAAHFPSFFLRLFFVVFCFLHSFTAAYAAPRLEGNHGQPVRDRGTQAAAAAGKTGPEGGAMDMIGTMAFDHNPSPAIASSAEELWRNRHEEPHVVVNAE
jgi:hypothetical protein